MKNVVVIVNDRRTLRKREVSRRQEELDDMKNAVLIDEDNCYRKFQTAEPQRLVTAV